MSPDVGEENIQDRIWASPDASFEEQVALEALVHQKACTRSEWPTVLQRVASLEELLTAVRSSASKDVCGEVAYAHPSAENAESVSLSRGARGRDLGGSARVELDREKRCEAYQQRLRALEAQSRDPSAHFEALTGQTIAER